MFCVERPNRANQVDAVFSRHREIAHEDVGRVSRETRVRLSRRGRDHDGRAVLFERRPAEFQCLRIVIHQED